MKKLTLVIVAIAAVLFSQGLMSQEIPDQLKQQIRSYQIERTRMHEELKLQLKQHENASRDEINDIVNQWRNQNADRIAEQQRLSEQIRTQLKEVIAEKQKQIENLPPEQKKQVMQQWMANNREYLSIGNGEGAMQTVRTSFREQAREHVDQQQSLLEQQQIRVRQRTQNGKSDSNSSEEGGKGSKGKKGKN